MTDETLNTDAPIPPAATTLTISAAIAARLADVAPLTRSKVVEHFAQKMATKQADALIAGIDKLDGLQKDLLKNKPDNVLFNEGGTQVSASYTKPKLEERNKLIEQIAKLEKAIDKADSKEDFGDLYNLIK